MLEKLKELARRARDFFNDREIDIAVAELKKRLREKGYNVDWPVPEGSNEYHDGYRVWVILADPCNDVEPASKQELMAKTAEIKEINVSVAAQFGLNPTGMGPVVGENALIFAYCGFKTLWM